MNDTYLHHRFKKLYRRCEQTLMLKMLKDNPKVIPKPSRQDVIDMAVSCMNKLNEGLDFSKAFKSVFVTNKLDGSEDLLIDDKLRTLVYEDMVKFRTELLATPPPKTLEELLKTITPPKGVKRKCNEVEG